MQLSIYLIINIELQAMFTGPNSTDLNQCWACVLILNISKVKGKLKFSKYILVN